MTRTLATGAIYFITSNNVKTWKFLFNLFNSSRMGVWVQQRNVHGGAHGLRCGSTRTFGLPWIDHGSTIEIGTAVARLGGRALACHREDGMTRSIREGVN